MRLGGWELVKAAAKKPEVGELGTSGTATMATGGNILLTQEDYNPDLRGSSFYDQIDRMRLSDSQVKAVMSIIKLPLLAADWGIEAASDDPQDVEIADWLQERFFEGQLRTWDYILRHMLLSLDFGVMPFEVVWDVRDDDILHRPVMHLVKLAPRMPRTVTEWHLEENGELKSIVQYAEKNGVYQEIEIPGDRLLVFTHDMEGSNYRGISILRQARKDWYIKERLQRINQVAIEKRAAGIDVGTLPPSHNTTQKDAFESVLQTIRTHERAYIIEPEGHRYRIEGITGQVLDPLPSIQYADLMILRAILADFLVAGTGTTGSWAMVQDRSSFFLMALGAIANELVAPVNRHLIPQWVRWNWPNVTQYPMLTHSRLDRRDVAAIATALKDLIPVGAMTPDDSIEQEMRELLEMPDMPEPDTKQLTRMARQGDSNLVAAYRKTKAPHRVPEGRSLEPRTPLEKAVNWVALERALDSATEKIVRAYKQIQVRQIAKVVEEGMKAIKADKSVGERAEMLENVNIPYRREAAAAIGKILGELYDVGQREVKQEMVKQGAEPVRLSQPLDAESDEVIKRFLKFRALAMAGHLSDRLKGSLLTNGLNMIRDDIADELVLRGTLTELSDRAISSGAGTVVSEALNLGREAMAKRNDYLVTDAAYSAILDERVCDVCSGLDRRHVAMGSTEYEDMKPPRPAGGAIEECAGRNRCRCVYIYTFAKEAKPRG